MTLNLLDQIGNWNPQLFREIKGRLKMGSIAIASAFSLGPQLLLFMYYRAQLPVAFRNTEGTEPIYNRFCVLKATTDTKPGTKCLTDTLGNLVIDWQKWSVEIFIWLSIFSVLTLLVAGTYMLVSDLDKEERRGTLNFIRLSPQSANTIFLGKIFGVPILLYLAAILVIPLHLYSGLTAQIPLLEILGFYMAVVASCSLFYSTAMLFGLTTSWLGGFQPWLASGIALFVFVISTVKLTVSAGDLGTFVSSIGILRYLVSGTIDQYDFGSLGVDIDKLQWFYLPIGKNIVSGLVLSLSICGIGTYWMWQGWQRRFPNPTTTVFSKRQSYFAVICCQPIILGFALQSNSIGYGKDFPLLALNLIMFLIVIASLTSDRQSLYDWARYRQQIVPSGHKLWRRYPLLDLVWSEKSPAIVAIAINLLSSSLIVICGLIYKLKTKMETFDINLFWGIIFGINLILIYAAITQLFLFLKTRNQEIWAAGTICGAILLPPVILSMLLLTLEKAPVFWLSTTLPIFWTSSAYMEFGTTILLSILSQWTILALLNLKLRSQLKLAGQSASRALLKA
ncbi:hypothetical protein [Tychonema sp. BBK16]|uniref:hypothetical protein n=1 Tax=Tychonema sp. BBK16 TaxID=2699888 RepID=UPI001F3DE217|nr:hypothetical protein [Tychonema sp. BBK16]MCF6375396.1 hypothetical protein [Tychonema sp. BBK16]